MFCLIKKNLFWQDITLVMNVGLWVHALKIVLSLEIVSPTKQDC